MCYTYGMEDVKTGYRTERVVFRDGFVYIISQHTNVCAVIRLTLDVTYFTQIYTTHRISNE